MPELPDIETYVTALRSRVEGRVLQGIRLRSPFVLRSVQPPIDALVERRLSSVSRLGKQIVFRFEGDLAVVLHLMVAGRLAWAKPGAGIPGRIGLAAFDFDNGSLLFREAAKKKRASIHVVSGDPVCAGFDRGGLEVIDSSLDDFSRVLTLENHTLKRALTDPRLFSGIGNAYSDEILHRARLSPLRWTSRLDETQICDLHRSAIAVLEEWTHRLHEEVGAGFPTQVTAFRPEMTVHGRYARPCPECGRPIQRIVYADNESNYCPTCQNGGRLLADRALSRLMKKDWPRTLEELEDWKGQRQGPASPGASP